VADVRLLVISDVRDKRVHTAHKYWATMKVGASSVTECIVCADHRELAYPALTAELAQIGLGSCTEIKSR